MSALTAPEQTTLTECESTIRNGLQTFYEVGQALRKIRDGKLYRESYATFEDYCKDRWQMSRPRAYQLMEGSQVVENLSTQVDIQPENERQVRPLKTLDPSEQGKAWTAAQSISNNAQPSPKTVRKATAAVKAKPQHFEAGSQVTVLDETSPHYGQQVEVLEEDGIIIQCSVAGNKDPIPFLCNELGEQAEGQQSQVEAPPKQKKEARSSPLEQLQMKLAIATARIELLETMLRRGCALGSEPSPNLRMWIGEARALLQED